MKLLLHWKSFGKHHLLGTVEGDFDSISQVYHEIVGKIRADLDVLQMFVVDQHGVTACDLGSPVWFFRPLEFEVRCKDCGKVIGRNDRKIEDESCSNCVGPANGM